MSAPVRHRLLGEWCARLAAASARVVFADGDDPRVREAAGRIADIGITPVLVVDAGPTPTGVEAVTVEELADGPAGKRVAQVAADRGWPPPEALARQRCPHHLAAALVDVGGADAGVAGSAAPSGEVIRAAIRVLGLAPDTETLSSSFLMVDGDGRAMAFADCAVVPEPDPAQLAGIAVATAGTFETLTGQRASVAMLSFSTLGSADHESVRLVRAATALARDDSPGLAIDGELQFDAALVAAVGRRKAAGSPVAGQANVFVFPNLSAGNIGYKIAERLGGVQAFGPILQGLRRPMNDLSRGCGVEDIVNVAVISALQATALSSAVRPSPYHNR